MRNNMFPVTTCQRIHYVFVQNNIDYKIVLLSYQSTQIPNLTLWTKKNVNGLY